MHFADILNSQLMYTEKTVNERRSYPDTLISKVWFLLRIFTVQISIASPITLFRSLIVLAFGIVKLLLPVHPKQRV